jgi:hypothetical protein
MYPYRVPFEQQSFFGVLQIDTTSSIYKATPFRQCRKFPRLITIGYKMGTGFGDKKEKVEIE